MSTKPVRIQRKRTKGFDLQAASPNGLPVVYVGRPSKWGNPYKVGVNAEGIDMTVEECLAEFEADLKYMSPEVLAPLRGKNLACWCPLDQPCHADVLLRIANELTPTLD